MVTRSKAQLERRLRRDNFHGEMHKLILLQSALLFSVNPIQRTKFSPHFDPSAMGDPREKQLPFFPSHHSISHIASR